MQHRKWTRRYFVLLIMSAMMLLAVSGCASSGELPPNETSQQDTQVDQQKQNDPASSGGISTTEIDPPVKTQEPEQSGAMEPEMQSGEVPAPGVSNEPADPVASDPAAEAPSVPEELIADTKPVDADLEDEAVALSSAPAAVSTTVSAVASGVLEKRNGDAVIDYSNTADGYVMVQHLVPSDARLKVQVKGPSTTYTYNLKAQEWTVFPLSDGNGAYQISIYKNVTGTKYAAVLSLSTQVALKDEFAPFLHSNQYVDYDHAPNTAAKAAELIGAVDDPLKQVEIVYDYVVKGMTYDKELAATVKSGYLPVLDSVLEKKTGICFDYAALMTGMLRSQGVPCKLVVGYAGSAYHAWISVWVDGSGWVDGVIWFDGASWQRMDPTFASSGNSSESILNYIGDGTNYTAKYFY